jgi:hypothetical protein
MNSVCLYRYGEPSSRGGWFTRIDEALSHSQLPEVQDGGRIFYVVIDEKIFRRGCEGRGNGYVPRTTGLGNFLVLNSRPVPPPILDRVLLEA